MNRRLTINRLALGNLKARKKQYLIMIIGIVLAMVFSSSVLFAVSAISNSRQDLNEKMFAKCNFIYLDADEEFIAEGKSRNLFGDCGYGHVIGTGFSTTENNYDSLVVAWLDEKAENYANPLLIEGRYPTAENEIAIEAITLSKLQLNSEIGGKITLKLYPQDGDKTLEKPVEKTYTLVGILENKKNNICFSTALDENKMPSAFVCKDTPVEPGGKESLVCYGMFKNSKDTKANALKLENLASEYGFGEGYGTGFAIISSKASTYVNDSTAVDVKLEIIFIIIIISVFMLASCLSVINSFNTNLKERKKQIGMYRAVGATKRQIIKTYGREAFILSLVATPFSCFISYFLVKLIISLLGENYSYHPSWWVFIVTALFGIFSVMLSALVPLASASRITPIQAIRNIENARKMNSKHIKSNKSYDVSSLISKRSVIFGKSKQIAVTLILIISIIASGYAVSYYTYAVKNPFSNTVDYELGLSSDGGYCLGVNFRNENNGFNEADRRMVEISPYIASSNGIKKAYVNMLVPYNTSNYRKAYSDRYEYDMEYSGQEITTSNYEKAFFTKMYDPEDMQKLSEALNTDAFMMSEITCMDISTIKTFEKYVYDGKINPSKLASGEEVILIAPKRIGVTKDQEKFGWNSVSDRDAKVNDYALIEECDFKAGDEIEIATVFAQEAVNDYKENASIIPDNTEVYRKKVKIGAIINLEDYITIGSYFISNFGILTTNNVFDALAPGVRYKDITFSLNCECNDEIDKSVQALMNTVAAGVDQGHAQSNYGYQQMQKQENSKFLVSVMAILIFIFTVALSIVNNTLTASIRSSKRKIGTLRAVGADTSVLVKAYIKQMLSMISWGSVIGLAGFAISFVSLIIMTKIQDGTTKIDFIFNPIASILFVIVLIVVCSINLYSKVKKEMKNSIVENIREL